MDDRRGADAEDGWLTVGEASLYLGLTPGGVRALERLRRLRAGRKNRYAPIPRDGAVGGRRGAGAR